MKSIYPNLIDRFCSIYTMRKLTHQRRGLQVEQVREAAEHILED